MENVTEGLGEETQWGGITFEKEFTFFKLKFIYSEKATKFEKIFHLTLLSSVKSKQNIFSNFCGLLRISELFPHFNDIFFRENPAAHKVENSFRKDFPLLMQSCLEAVWPATYQNLSGLKCISYKVRGYKLLDQPLLKMIKLRIHFPSCAFRVV